jgi:cardiolipin synthase (CMP-forming)
VRRIGLRSAANLFSALRIALLPVLWGVAIAGHPRILAWLLLLAWSTDAIDGFLARRSGKASPGGSRLDTIADHLLFLSMGIWVVMLRPDFVAEQLAPILAWLVLWAAALIVGLVRFRRLADLHLWSSKVAVFLVVVFTVHLFLVETYSTVFFHVTVSVCVLAAVEMLIVHLGRDRPDEHIGTVLRRRPDGTPPVARDRHTG